MQIHPRRWESRVYKVMISIECTASNVLQNQIDENTLTFFLSAWFDDVLWSGAHHGDDQG